jgi:hypothetical protein
MPVHFIGKLGAWVFMGFSLPCGLVRGHRVIHGLDIERPSMHLVSSVTTLSNPRMSGSKVGLDLTICFDFQKVLGSETGG